MFFTCICKCLPRLYLTPLNFPNSESTAVEVIFRQYITHENTLHTEISSNNKKKNDSRLKYQFCLGCLLTASYTVVLYYSLPATFDC